MNTKQCEKCIYYSGNSAKRKSTVNKSQYCCTYYLDTGMRRERDGDICLSRKEGQRTRGAWDMPATSASTLAGYKT